MSLIHYALLGHPVAHSLSPAMHNAAFQHLDLECRYHLVDVPPDNLANALSDIRSGHYAGANVTIPHKRLAANHMDSLDPWAKRSGSVNTICRLPDGSLHGMDTDGRGFLHSLKEEGIQIQANNRVCLIGAGGSATAVASALVESGLLHVRVATRTPANAPHTLHNMAQSIQNLDAPLESPDLLIQTTPVGMQVQANSTQWSHAVSFFEKILPPDCSGVVGVDLIYTPAKTPFLRVVEDRGGRAVSGLGMLIHQGALAFEAWTGKPAPTHVFWDAAKSALTS